MNNFKILIVIALLFCSESFAGELYVKWVYDGDTVLLNNGIKVRYLGINTPEISHGRKKGEPFGNRAKNYNISLVKGKKIILKYDAEKRDHYGRVLAYVFLKDKTFVNAELIKRGFAHLLYKKPNTKYFKFFLKLQREAIRKKTGFWAFLKGKKSMFPSNRSSKRFHRQNCKNGKMISRKNLIIFNYRREAFFNGYAPCKQCNP